MHDCHLSEGVSEFDTPSTACFLKDDYLHFSLQRSTAGIQTAGAFESRELRILLVFVQEDGSQKEHIDGQLIILLKS